MKRTIVLLGGSGFIGTALAKTFAARGDRVRIVSRSEPPSLPRGARWIRAAIDDRRAVAPALAGADCVFHLASESVPGTRFSPAEEAGRNLLPTLRLVERLPEAARLVFVSTGGAIYGDARRARAAENEPLAPLSYYAAGKAALESFIGAHARLHQRDAVIVRPANVFGPGQKVAPGFGLVPALFSAAAHGRPFHLFGGGDAVRDYLYIDDLCALCVALARAPRRAGVRVYNAGSGRGVSVARMVRAAERTTGRRLALVREPGRPGDVRRIVLDSAKARRDFGWRAEVPLAEGLARTWRWYTAATR